MSKLTKKNDELQSPSFSLYKLLFFIHYAIVLIQPSGAAILPY